MERVYEQDNNYQNICDDTIEKKTSIVKAFLLTFMLCLVLDIMVRHNHIQRDI